jgi:MFS transporter, YNFM family, putative membrane transport protein
MQNAKGIESMELPVLRNINRSTFILFWTGLVVLCSLYVTIPLLSVFASTYDLSASQAAWAGSTFSFSFAVGCLFFGAISDRFGKKKVMVIGLFCLSIVTFIIGLTNSFNQLLILRGIQGATAATFSPVALTYIGLMFPDKKKVTTIGIISSGFLIAGIIGQLISTLIESTFNWNMVFYFFSIIYLITTIFLFIILPTDRIKQENKDIFAVVKKFILPFKQNTLILCNSIGVMVLLSFVGMYTALGHYLNATFHFNDQEIFYVRAVGIFGMILSPLTGRFVQKFGMNKVLTTGLLCAIIGLFFMGFSNHLWIIILMSILFVCGIAIVVPSMLALVGQLGGNEKGIATSVYTFILFIGASIGPLLATFILQTGNTSLPFFVFGCLLTIGLFLSTIIHSLIRKNNSVSI